jgi:tetratricopeptide (TPR) repeat protein
MGKIRMAGMKKYCAFFFAVVCVAATVPAQDYDWEDSGYDWDTEIEEPPDFIDPYAPVIPAPIPVPVAPLPAPVPSTPSRAATGTVPQPEVPDNPVPAEQTDTPKTITLRGQYYTVTSDGGQEDAELLLSEFEQRLKVYNQLFHFDPDAITGPLQVRSIQDAGEYDSHVRTQLGQVPAEAVYIHYNQGNKRELVIHRGGTAEGVADPRSVVPYQAFIQYLRAFIPHPPAWIREGFAIFFNGLIFDPDTKQLRFEENLAWLDTVKILGNHTPELQALLLSDTEEYSSGMNENFQPLAWALASFFLNSGDENYFRSLGEIFMTLSPNTQAEENSRAAVKRLLLWTDFETLTTDYRDYLASRRTFAELIGAGQKAYAAGDRDTAELLFREALTQRPEDGVPYYYLGIMAFEDKKFDRAESFYNSALKYGTDSALVRYALGINTLAAGHTADALRWLEQAAAEAPDRYGEKVGKLLGQLR